MSIRYKALRRARYQTNCGLRNGTAVIADNHPCDGRQWDWQCARCGSSMDSAPCSSCGGDGYHELYDEDPLFYDPGDTSTCDQCYGEGYFAFCMSSSKYCEAHPLPGRGKVPPHTPEWFTFDPVPKNSC